MSDKPGKPEKRGLDWRWKVGGAALGATVTVVAAPAALTFLGFGAGGVAAGSAAAGAMSSVGNVAAGSSIAILQSAGAAGFSSTTTAFLAGTGAAIGGASVKLLNRRWIKKGAPARTKTKDQSGTADRKDTK